MTITSEILLNTQTYSGDGELQTSIGDKAKGDGYYGRSDGFHTVQLSLTDFVGRIDIQGSLAVDPTDEDWFTVELGTGDQSVDTTGLLREENVSFVEYPSATTNTRTYNFTGNYVWIRSKVSNWSEGTVNSIRLNH